MQLWLARRYLITRDGYRIEQVWLVQPKKVFLMAGINDVANSEADEFQERYDSLMVSLKELLPKVEIIVQSLLPVNYVDFIVSCTNSRIESCNERIKLLCAKHKLKYIDLYSLYSVEGRLAKGMTVDGIHLRPEVYERWYELLKTRQKTD